MNHSQAIVIRSYVAGLLLAAPALSGGNVLQNRSFQLAQGVSSQLHVNVTGSNYLELHLGNDKPRDWETELELQVLARKVLGVEASEVADAVWVDAYARIMADPTLGGLVWELTPGDMTTDSDEADTSMCRLVWTLTVKHRTTNNVLT